MKKILFVILSISIVAFLASNDLFARGNNPGPVIYVENQDLFFDAVIAAESLPMKGPFQLLYECEAHGVVGLCTEFGPGDFGFYGGRWWIDDNGDGMMNEGDVFFSCPLLGPGRDMP